MAAWDDVLAIDATLLAEPIEDAWRTQAPKRLVSAYDGAGG